MDPQASVGSKPRLLGSSGAMMMPYYEPYGPMWGIPSMVPPPNYNYQIDRGNQAQGTSQGKQLSQLSSKSPALSGPKKRKAVEFASESQSKAGSTVASSCPLKPGKKNPQMQAAQFQAAKRIESFAKVNLKAQLYQASTECFRRSLVFHNWQFCKNIQESNLVDLIDKSEEVQFSIALK
jgi:hypothetical protein